MKKILCIICTAFILINSITVYAKGSTQSGTDMDIIGLFEAIGIISPDIDMQKKLTIGDFSQMLYNCLNTRSFIENSLTEDKSEEENSTIKIKETTVDYLQYVNDMGLFKYVSEDTSANAPLTSQTALIVLTNMLGYDYVSQSRAEIMKHASDLKLSIGVDTLNMNYSNVCRMLYNAMYAERILPIHIDKGYEKSEFPFIEEYIHIKEIKGIVTDNGISALNGESNYTQDYIAIDNNVYYAGNNNARDLLGHNVMAFVAEGISETLDVLVYISSYETNVIEIGANDILEIKKDLVTYKEIDGVRERKIKIASGFDYLYNNYAEKLEDVLKLDIPYGKLILIDNNDDSKADVVHVKEYESFRISSIDKINFKVYNKNTPAAMNFNSNFKYTLVKDNEEIGFEDLKINETLTIYFNKDRDYADIYVTNSWVDGKITQTISNEEKLRVFINDKWYYVAQSCADKVELGYKGEFYLDAEGEIIDIDPMFGTGDTYGYFMKAYMDDAGDNMYVRMYSSNGYIEDLPIGEKIYIDAVEYTNHQLALNALSREQIIQYETNAKNEVIMIDTLTVTDGSENDDFNCTLEKTNLVHRSYGIFNGLAAADENTAIMIVPADTSDKKGFGIGNYAMFEWDTYYTIGAYDTRENGVSGLIVLFDSASSKSYMFVDRTIQTINEDGEICTKVIGLQKGQVKEILGSNKDFPILKSVEKGDIVSISSFSTGEVAEFSMIFEAGEAVDKFASGAAYDTKDFYGIGEVLGAADDRVYIDFGNDQKYVTNTSNIKIYAIVDNEITHIACEEISKGDMVFLGNGGFGHLGALFKLN